ncbi:hypothetical protein COL26_23385 [Bacillus thuringiensis]|uniref:Uncharacterized protein n=2 Tax=Bacillus thuringiensis TaxID=1428 RepID=A0ABD6SB89_BACTU|nr:hypothetical protein CN495_30430 [Bacillus thuringiensis]PEU74681.1 hypothetical protein CN411_31470 [Bacillus thuringiensis]PFH95367.1 hypothetical protein COI79_34790 [Bacillus thuringiensis]PFW33229.1 hypothetical protein COL26_23385 [Bacillus thuringiensis]PGY63178.1 hypothetical protein COE44_32455 [Bacillus thuringiensis]
MDMDQQKALELLNSLEIYDYDADGEILYYALVKLNEDNKKVIESLLPEGVNFNEGLDDKGELFDITLFCWEYAEWFNGDQFMAEEPKEVYCESN